MAKQAKTKRQAHSAVRYELNALSGAAASQNKEFKPQELFNLVGYQLRRAHTAVFEAFSAIMAKRGIAPGHFSILTLILLNPDRTQTWLSEACGLDRSTIAPIIKHLEESGLVKRERNPHDQRAYQLRLSREGVQLVNSLGPRIQTYENHITRNFTPQECQQLIELLRRLEAAA